MPRPPATRVSDVLFSGQDAMDPLLVNSAGYTVGALLLTLVLGRTRALQAG